MQEAAALDPRFKMKWCRGAEEEGSVQTKLEELAGELRISNPSPSYYKADENVNDSKVGWCAVVLSPETETIL